MRRSPAAKLTDDGEREKRRAERGGESAKKVLIDDRLRPKRSIASNEQSVAPAGRGCRQATNTIARGTHVTPGGSESRACAQEELAGPDKGTSIATHANHAMGA